MTFLELCVEAAKKCSITGAITDVAAATGERARLVGWVSEAWYDIQNSSTNWDWMRHEFTFNTTASVQEYSPATIGATDFSRWHDDTFRIQKTSLTLQDEQFLPMWGYETFRNTYMFGVRNLNRPTVFALRPRGKSILLGDTPNDIYTVSGEYQKKATRMAIANGSTPDMPDEYHMGIVHKARIKYAAFENAPEVMAEAQIDFDTVMGPLYLLNTEMVSTGNPLA